MPQILRNLPFQKKNSLHSHTEDFFFPKIVILAEKESFIKALNDGRDNDVDEDDDDDVNDDDGDVDGDTN